MSYQSYPQISSTPPPMMTSDTQTMTPYQNVSSAPSMSTVPVQNMQMQPAVPVYTPPPVYAPPPVYTPPQVYTAPAPIYQAPNTMAQPSLPIILPNLEEEVSKGWSFINILLILLLLCSCITSIVNFIDGELINGCCCILCLCLFYWLYSYYNRHDSTPLPKLPTNLGGININVR